MWGSVADRVALALAPIVALLDPASIVLGGPTGVAGGVRLASLVQHRIDAVQYPRPDVRGARPHIAVRASTTGSESILLGARQVLVAHIRAPTRSGDRRMTLPVSDPADRR